MSTYKEKVQEGFLHILMKTEIDSMDDSLVNYMYLLARGLKEYKNLFPPHHRKSYIPTIAKMKIPLRAIKQVEMQKNLDFIKGL